MSAVATGAATWAKSTTGHPWCTSPEANQRIWELSIDHGDGPSTMPILATEEEIEALAEEIRQRNLDIESIGWEPGGDAMSISEIPP